MNKSIMMGRVVKDPDLRYTQTENGELAIANFRLAVNRKFVRRGDPEGSGVIFCENSNLLLPLRNEPA